MRNVTAYKGDVSSGLFATVFSISAGVLFGPFWGTVYTVIGATLGATVAFLISRKFGRKTAERFLKGRLKGIDEFSEKHGVMTTLILRLVPGPPFDMLNYGLGLSKISLRDYVVGTFFGIMPGAFAYVYFGASLRVLELSQILSALLILVLLIGIPTLYKRNKSNQMKDE
ncbi:MAG: TVP38/TMEM64 family protein [Candidatus Hydrothermarchaeales archaeon]